VRNQCSVVGCLSNVVGFGFCKKHYRVFKKGIDPHAPVVPKSKVCSVKGCGEPIKARGYCNKHLQRLMAGKDPEELSCHELSTEGRFFKRVTKTEGCWKWQGRKNTKGYGHLSIRGRVKTIAAHRLSYQIHVGPVPDGMFILHKCDNPGCVNPAHLFLGTNADNMADMVSKGRQTSILKAEDIPKIRAMAANKTTQAEIAAHFGVKRANISAVITGRTWGHIP